MIKNIKEYVLAHKIDVILCIAVFCIAVFFQFFELEKRFYFEWDQERDAEVIWTMVRELKPALIGPRVVSDNAFFLGPLWYYVLLPGYTIFGLDPIGAAVTGSLIMVATTVAIFLFCRKVLSKPVAFIAAFMAAIFFHRSAWNPMLIPIFTLMVIYLSKLLLDGKHFAIPLLFFVFGLSLQAHFQAIFFVAPILLSLFFYVKQNRNIPKQKIALGFGLLLLTFLPQLAFDLRHDFINTKGLLNFFLANGEAQVAAKPFYESLSSSFDKFIASASFALPLFEGAHYRLGLATIVLAIVGLSVLKTTVPYKVVLLALFYVPVLGLSFYGGSISEYYYYISYVLIIIGLASVLAFLYTRHFLGKVLVVVILAVLLCITTKNFFNQRYIRTLYFKRMAVEFIATQPFDPIFNVSYSTILGYDHGFAYLFKLQERQPQNIPEGHLWTIVVPPNNENVPPMAVFGDVGVIRR